MFSTDTSEASYDQLDFYIMQTHIIKHKSNLITDYALFSLHVKLT